MRGAASNGCPYRAPFGSSKQAPKGLTSPEGHENLLAVTPDGKMLVSATLVKAETDRFALDDKRSALHAN